MSQASNQLNLLVTEHDHIQGSVGAPVLLVEYGDYQCPYSGQAYSIVKQIQQRLTDQLYFVFRHFPLVELHPQAQKAAEAAEVAAAQGKFWHMHNTLFEHQQSLDDASLVEYALELSLDMPQFLRQMSEHTHAGRVQEDLESGERSGVKSTPTFFINGVRHKGAWNSETLLAAIAEASNSQPK